MADEDLYPKGKKLFHRRLGVMVEYVCHAGEGIHIVLAPALDFIDDRVREASSADLIDMFSFQGSMLAYAQATLAPGTKTRQ